MPKQLAGVVEEMKRLVKQSQGDAESAHGAADDLLCEVLERLGQEELVAEYRKVKKWYA